MTRLLNWLRATVSLPRQIIHALRDERSFRVIYADDQYSRRLTYREAVGLCETFPDAKEVRFDPCRPQ